MHVNSGDIGELCLRVCDVHIALPARLQHPKTSIGSMKPGLFHTPKILELGKLCMYKHSISHSVCINCSLYKYITYIYIYICTIIHVNDVMWFYDLAISVSLFH